MSHADLIARLEKAAGPHPYLDEAIWEAIGGWPERKWRSVDYMKAFGTPVTGSLDAAVSLVERVLPDCDWGRDDVGYMQIYHPHTDDCVEAKGATPAIALLIATLKALQEKHNER